MLILGGISCFSHHDNFGDVAGIQGGLFVIVVKYLLMKKVLMAISDIYGIFSYFCRWKYQLLLK